MKDIENEDKLTLTDINFEELSSSPEQYIQTLIASLGNPDERVRKCAFEVMCELADERAVKILTGYLNHKDNLVRYSVKKALEAVREKCPGRFDDIIDGKTSKAPDKYNFWFTALFLTAALFILFLILFLKTRNDNYKSSETPLQYSKDLKNRQTAAAVNNVIKYDAKGFAVIKISGIVSSYNSIKREAQINLNSYGDACRIIFGDDMKIDFMTGSKIDIQAEILHNDNINPVLLKAKSYKIIKQ